MRHTLLLLVIICLTGLTAIAQNPDYGYGLSFKALFMDYQSQNGGSISDFKSYHHGFEIGVQKQLQENININLPVKAGVVSGIDREGSSYHRTIYGADLQVQYLFYQPETVITPYVMAGIGAVNEQNGKFNMQVPFGVGINFKMAENAFINWQSEFRYSLEDDRNNLHHGLGFVYLFGESNQSVLQSEEDGMEEKEDKEKEMKKDKKNAADSNLLDSDGDGLEDDIDLCPQAAGPADMKGCPDMDEDGIPDYRDDCPSIYGLRIFKGCPDTDMDGISDSKDECPNLPGVQANNGCPEEKEDRDGDGVEDAADKCPDLAGSASAMGCPDADGDGIADTDDHCPNAAGLRAMSGRPDSDGDGIHDGRDNCPDVRGTVAAGGCPEVSKEDLSVLELAMRAVSFDTGNATLRPESYPILNQIANIMKKYPGYNLLIEGHTDNVGSAVNNQLLSERRAKSCYDYLVAKGIDEESISYIGYGESRPINSNESLRGRSLNRRVEFKLKPKN